MYSDVLVAGGGPSGSMAAMLLARQHKVTILEEHRNPGVPIQCAGLVTHRGVPKFARESILNEVRGARLHSPLGFVLTLESKSARACVVDRTMFDRAIFHRAVDAGAHPQVESVVKAVSFGDSSMTLEVRTDKGVEHLSSKVVVGADGYKSVCRKAARLPAPKHMLTGVQVDMKGADLDSDFVELYFGGSVAPGFFAWAIPADDMARVGVCTWDAKVAPAVYLRRLLSRPEFAGAKKVSVASGKIPIGPARTAVRGRMVLVGDAACHAKPLSGGGIYTGIRGAELCAAPVSRFLSSNRIADIAEYDRLWREEFGKELSRAFRVRKVFLNLSDKKLDRALRIFAEPDVKRLLEERGDIDYPASLSSSVLKLAPKLVEFSPQLIESFL